MSKRLFNTLLVVMCDLARLLRALHALFRSDGHRGAACFLGVFLRASARNLPAISNSLGSNNTSFSTITTIGPYYVPIASSSGSGNNEFFKSLAGQFDTFGHTSNLTHIVGGVQCLGA